MTLNFFAADPDAPWQQTSLHMTSPPSGATFLATTGDFAWTPPEGTWPAQVNLQVIATDTGIPPLSVTNAVTVTITEPFRLRSEAASGGFLAPVIPGQYYQIEWTGSLTPTFWQLLETVEAPPSGPLYINDPSGDSEDLRYYRILWLPGPPD